MAHCVLWDYRFLQLSCWRFQPLRAYCCFVGSAVPERSKDQCTLTFTIKQSEKTAWSWMWRHNDSLIYQEMLVQWQCAAS